jgi:exonuclease SbcC
MRPHELRVTAFGAFAETEKIRFDDLEGLFLLHGETGAGKTTLLDAIAFALYGKVPGERGKAKRLRSDHAAVSVSTEVRLEATIGGRRLRVTRKPEQERPKRSGTGMTREQASVILEEATAAGGWEIKSTRVGEADVEILDLMGMSADQFFQVVLLPQGQFAQFLHAGAEARAELLQKLFGTDRFRAVEDWLAERRRVTAAAVVSASAGVDHLMARVSQVAGVPVPDETADPVSWAADLVASAAARRDDAAAVVASRKASLDAALTAKSEADQLAGRQRRRDAALREKARLEAAAPVIARLRAEAEAAGRAAEVAPVIEAADRAAKAAADARRAEERARAALPRDQEPLRTASAASLRAAGEEQRARFGRLDGLRAVARQAAADEHAAAVARKSVADLETALAKGGITLTERRQARDGMAAARDSASRAADTLPTARASADSARRVADDSAALVKQNAVWQRLREASLTAREKALGLREDANHVREARIDGMRAELAAALVDDTPCPVCGSLDHPDPVEPTFEPVSREREEAAFAIADKAAAEAEKAGEKVAAADAVISDLIQRLAAAGFTSPAASPAGRAAAPDPAALDATALATAARATAADASRLEAEASRLRQAAAKLPELQRALDELDEAIAIAERTQVGLAGQRSAAIAESEGAAQRAGQARESLRAQLGGAPDLDTALSAARRLAEALSGAADAADRAVRAADEARDARARAAAAAADAGFADAGEVRVAFRDAKRRAEAAERIKRHEAETEAVARLLADPDLNIPLDPPAPVAERAEAASAAQHAHDTAVDAHGRAEHTAEQLRLLRPQLADALNALEPLKARADEARQLADLAAGGGANQYKMTLSSFVLAARLEEVAAAASQRLLTMTAGRYSLMHTDARRRGGARSGLGLLACDAWTGQDRDTSTLSGGETFLASLSLALGLADVVTAEAAGAPMEALFVDEGFGTLDEDTLEEVMNVLDGLREGGRIVGIVSHVTELRQRIPVQVHVRKGHHGSHVAVTVG